MKIISKGKLPESELYQGKCFYCKTVIEITKGEGKYNFDQKDGSDWITYKCPTCKCEMSCFKKKKSAKPKVKTKGYHADYTVYTELKNEEPLTMDKVELVTLRLRVDKLEMEKNELINILKWFRDALEKYAKARRPEDITKLGWKPAQDALSKEEKLNKSTKIFEDIWKLTPLDEEHNKWLSDLIGDNFIDDRDD